MIIDLRRLLFAGALLCAGFVAWSMLHDDTDLEPTARELSCRGRVCNAVLQKRARNLFGWTFTYGTYGDNTLVVDVTCTRTFWVVGDYHCDISETDRAADVRFR